MTTGEAEQIMRQALAAYHDQWTGHHSSVGPFSASEKGRAYHANAQSAAR